MNTTEEVIWDYRQTRDLTVDELSALTTDELLAECARVRADLVAVIERSQEARAER